MGNELFTFSGVHKTGLDLSQVLAAPSARGLCVHQSTALVGLPCLLLRGSVIGGLCVCAVGRGVNRSHGQLLRMAGLQVTAVHNCDEKYDRDLMAWLQDAGAPKIFTHQNAVRSQRYYIALLLTSFAVGLLIVFRTNSSYARLAQFPAFLFLTPQLPASVHCTCSCASLQTDLECASLPISTGTAVDHRWWEARTHWGGMLGITRNIMRQAS